jgi:hypothetical protein
MRGRRKSVIHIEKSIPTARIAKKVAAGEKIGEGKSEVSK